MGLRTCLWQIPYFRCQVTVGLPTCFDRLSPKVAIPDRNQQNLSASGWNLFIAIHPAYFLERSLARFQICQADTLNAKLNENTLIAASASRQTWLHSTLSPGRCQTTHLGRKVGTFYNFTHFRSHHNSSTSVCMCKMRAYSLSCSALPCPALPKFHCAFCRGAKCHVVWFGYQKAL